MGPVMLDPFGAGVHAAHRRAVLLKEADRERLLALAQRAHRSSPTGRPELARRWEWRPALFRVGEWLVEAGLRLQSAAQPRVRLA